MVTKRGGLFHTKQSCQNILTRVVIHVKLHRNFYALLIAHLQEIVLALTDLLTPWGRVLPLQLTGSQPAKKFPHFMELGGSLSHSQVSATQLDPVHNTTFYFLKIHLNIILPSTNAFPSVFPTRTLYTPLLSRYNWDQFYGYNAAG
jgi:hypothetical protein